MPTNLCQETMANFWLRAGGPEQTLVGIAHPIRWDHQAPGSEIDGFCDPNIVRCIKFLLSFLLMFPNPHLAPNHTSNHVSWNFPTQIWLQITKSLQFGSTPRVFSKHRIPLSRGPSGWSGSRRKASTSRRRF